MSKIEIRLDHLRGHAQRDDPIIWNARVPQSVESQLFLDFNRLKHFSQIAGIKQLTVTGVSGNTSIYGDDFPLITSQGQLKYERNSDVLMHQEALVATKVDQDKDEEPKIFTFSDFHRGKADIEINMSELTDRINIHTETKAQFKKPDLWANLLNNALADGIYLAAKQNLLATGKASEYSRGLFYLTALSLGSIATSDLFFTHNNDKAAIAAGSVLTFYEGFLNFLLGIRRNDARDFKWSFFPGYNLDRVAASLVLPKVLKLIKV